MGLLTKDFYLQENVVDISRSLLGKCLYTRAGKSVTGGIITETEAYAGITDRASHAFNNRRTARTETMYCSGGVAYVYFCYGMHYMFNIVTNKKNIPHAVLVRAIHPVTGIPRILKRRNAELVTDSLCNGPGKVTHALGINKKDDRVSLCGKRIWIEDTGINPAENEIICGQRIGVAYAGEDALLPYRYCLKRHF